MKKLKILFANGRTCPPFNVGGDGVSIHTWLSQLSQRGCVCQAMGVLNPAHYSKKEQDLTRKLIKFKIPFKWETKPYRQLNYRMEYPAVLIKRKDFLKELVKKIHEFKPDVLLTQLELSPEVLEAGQKIGLPVIFFIHDAEKENFLTINRINPTKSPIYVVFNSYFTQSKYSDFLKIPHGVLYPPLNPKDYLVFNNSKRYITMINPVKEKGGLIFQRIAAKLPNKQFLAIEGWCDPKAKGVDLKRYKNVTFWQKQDDMKRVYNQTKILLVPSIWEEGFGRVVIEAGVNGIPSIASKIGGLHESVGNGGMLINNFQSLNEWVKSIRKLDENDTFYTRLSLRAKQHAKKFNLKKEVGKLLQILEEVTTK